METVLMVVTLVALTLAIAMSVVAWRLLRDDRLRSNVRVDALREMADAADDEREPEMAPRKKLPRVPRVAPDLEPSFEEMRFRSLDEDPELELKWDAPLNTGSHTAKKSRPSPRREAVVDVPEPTFGPTTEGVPNRRWAVLAAVAVVMAGAAGSVYALYRPGITDAIPSARELASPATLPGAPPIELLSLRHAVDADGTFTVTGLVQNPMNGLVARHVIAVVYLFDRDGHYFASGKAALDFTAIEPGEESPFIVHVPNVGRVSRYRVGFRSEEGGVVAHVDRRGQLPGGTTGDAIEGRPSVTPASTQRSEG